MKRISLLGIAALLAACSDYDLHRPDKAEPEPDEEPEPDPEPSEDPDIAVSPASLEFGGHPKDCPAEPIQLTLTNEGLGDLEVTSITLNGSGNSAFNLQWDGSPFTLAYEETRTLDVEFTPDAWYTYEISVQVESNDPDEGRVTVPTSGFGAEDTTYEETFIQEYNEVVDVLWVVDNSCSMDEELNQVSTNFSTFIDEWTQLDLDYHLGVVTTDMATAGHSGELQGPYITPATADPHTAFLDQVDQGSSGSADEKGFAAVQAALTEPLVSGANAGFFRSEAALAIIVLSDEDDGSGTSPTSFSTWLTGLKSDPSLVNFNAICGDRGLGCQEIDFFGNSLSASSGGRYIDASDQTGGFWASICTSDYQEVLQHISLAAAGMVIEFALAEEPSSLSLLSVEVGGASVNNDSIDGWTYRSDANSIVFHGSAIPGPGESVRVNYPVAAECE